MALFLKKHTIRENRIENHGKWPIRLTDFFLVDEYEFPPSRFTEVFLVRAGHFLHETESGTQAVRSGTAVVHHPASRHVVKQPEQVRLTRVRFLPESFAGDFPTILRAPDVLSLFFAPSWFQLPQENRIQVFTTRLSQQPFVTSVFDLLHQHLRTGRHAESVSRVTLLHLLFLLADEYQVYWRGGNRLDLAGETLRLLETVERSVASGARLPLKQLQADSGRSQDDLNQVFRKQVGMPLVDYAQNRRVHHAALRLQSIAEPLAETAALFGFSDPSQMEKAFEKSLGIPPAAYALKFGPGAGGGESPGALGNGPAAGSGVESGPETEAGAEAGSESKGGAA